MMLRLFQMDDISELVALDKQAFVSSWDEEMFLYEYYHNPFAKLYVLLDHDKIVGYIDFWLLGDQCQLSRIAVLQGRQGQGLGKQLMELCIKESKSLGYRNINLEVRVSNTKAIAFYKRFGFLIVAIRKQYYENNEDAYLMVKEMEDQDVTNFSD